MSEQIQSNVWSESEAMEKSENLLLILTKKCVKQNITSEL